MPHSARTCSNRRWGCIRVPLVCLCLWSVAGSLCGHTDDLQSLVSTSHANLGMCISSQNIAGQWMINVISVQASVSQFNQDFVKSSWSVANMWPIAVTLHHNIWMHEGLCRLHQRVLHSDDGKAHEGRNRLQSRLTNSAIDVQISKSLIWWLF